MLNTKYNVHALIDYHFTELLQMIVDASHESPVNRTVVDMAKLYQVIKDRKQLLLDDIVKEFDGGEK